MNILKMTALCALVAAPAWAETPTAAEVQAHCTLLGETAEIIMIRRQEKVPMSMMMAVSDHPVLQRMVRAAYDVPAFSTDRIKQATVMDFRNEVEAACYEAFTE